VRISIIGRRAKIAETEVDIRSGNLELEARIERALLREENRCRSDAAVDGRKLGKVGTKSVLLIDARDVRVLTKVGFFGDR